MWLLLSTRITSHHPVVAEAEAEAGEQEHAAKKLPGRRPPDAPFSGSPKVALLFLTRGPMPLEDLWHDFFEQAAILKHREAPGLRSRASRSLLSAVATTGGAANGTEASGLSPPPVDRLHDLLDPATGLLRLPTDQRLHDEALAAKHDEHNEARAATLEAPFCATSEPDPAGPIARQDLFSVHTHTRAAYAYPAHSIFAGTQLQRRVFVRWGQYSVAEAMRRLLQAALLDPRNQRFAFLSESCAPLFPPAVVHAQLLADARSRVSPCAKPGHPAARWGNQLYKPGLLSRRQWRKSSQWITLLRHHAEVAAADDELSAWMEQQCYSLNHAAGITLPPYLQRRLEAQGAELGDRPCVADEHYFATLLAVSCAGTLTFTEWEEPAWSPKLFTAATVDAETLQVMRRGRWEQRACPALRAMSSAFGLYRPSSDVRREPYKPMPDRCMLFARKFAPDAVQPLRHLGKACGTEGLALDVACVSADAWATAALVTSEA